MGFKQKNLKAKPGKHNKTKKWKKGHSCVSNPDAKTHRTAAKNRFFNVISGPSGLTQAAIAKHNALEEDQDGDVMLDPETASASARTASTWASNWTDCTNMTFNKVHRFSMSNSAVHKSILAVLAAITEVIKANDGKETDTEYFAALMTALENEHEDEETIAAITYLLSMSMKKVPAGVLKNKFSETSKVLVQVLAEQMNTNSPALLRSTVTCLARLLQVQDQGVWNHSSTTNVYNALLTFTIHSKPKVRKAAQEAVIAILSGSEFMTQASAAPTHHPACSTTAKHCISQIEKCGGTKEATVTLHILGLLQNVLPLLPQQSLKAVCETILKVMTLANVMVTSVSMRCLYHMFLSRPKPTNLSPELNGQIITALYDFQPGENDTQLMSAWLAVMKEAHSNLAKIKESLFLSHLPRYFTSAMTCLKGDKTDIAATASKGLVSVLKEDISLLEDTLASMIKSSAPNAPTPAHKVFKSVENGLSYQYHATWGLVLELLAVCFEVLGKKCGSIMSKCLHTLAELRDSDRFPYKTELDRAVGMAVRSMGPQQVLSSIPLQITGDQDSYDFPRSWLIPILRNNIRNTRLGFFTSFFLPLAAKLRTKAVTMLKEGRQVESKTYDTLQLQIWSLLPGFCIQPTDLTQSFGGIAKVLGAALKDREDIRMDIMASLRKLILQNINNEENRAEMAKYAKNYLPILFNIFTTQPENENDSRRKAVLETIKIYVRIANHQVIGQFMDMCINKVSEGEMSSFRRHALLDLAVAMVPFTDTSRLKLILPQALENLKSTDRSVQKKSYRILEEICTSESTECREFVSCHLEELQKNLLVSLSSSSPSAKAPRLRCLINILKQLRDEQMDFLQNIVPEAILCTKETAEKARRAAYELLAEILRALFRWNYDTPKTAVVQMYFEMILAGLAGKPHMISCTLLALSRLVYEAKDYISDDLLSILLESVCLLIKSKAREIVEAALGLLRVILVLFDDLTIGQFLDNIISSLVSMKEDNRHHFRFKSKLIYTKLIRKFGFNVIISKVPQSLHKQLNNIRKTQERAKRKLKEGNPEEEEEEEEEMSLAPKPTKPESFAEYLADSDSDLDLEESSDRKGGRKMKKDKGKPSAGAAWLREGGEEGESVMDFLDPTVASRVMATKPQKATKDRKGKSDSDFKMASDGRLIITEEDEEEDHKKSKGSAPIDDLDELLDAFEGPGKKSRKRKLSIGEDLDDDEAPMKYKAGGSGIHRPVNDTPGKEYRAKKAGGDMKKKGKMEPFAYVPLDKAALNRRKKAKNAGQFRNLVKGAKKGALKGQKQRIKKSR